MMQTKPIFNKEQIQNIANDLYDKIAHGDDAHRLWLKNKALEWAKGYFDPFNQLDSKDIETEIIYAYLPRSR